MPREEVDRELQDVFAPLPQRRHMNVDAAQAVEQVGAKQPPRDQLRERSVGRRDDAGVDATGAGAADALDRQVLDRAQQLGLRRQRQVGHFVEKQRAAVGVLELAPPAADAGGRPLFDAEQLRLEQRFDDRRAVDRDERPRPAAAQLVNLPRHELLAGAALAFDQHGEIGGGDTLDALAQRRHHRRRSNQRGGPVRRRARRAARPRRFQHEAAKLRRGREQVDVALVERPAPLERGFQHRLDPIVRGRHAQERSSPLSASA